jgi:patatin-like phospholipase/acyl hydrolase
MSLVDRLDAPGPKRILALDGGGIRGAVTVGFLDRMESILREQHQNPDLVLSGYFDLIGGTSTGSIIAALLATGRHTSQIRELYLKLGGRIFGSEKFQLPVVGAAFGPKFSDAPLQEELKRLFGDMELGDPGIRTGLCIVTKRADTGSVWPLFNHPRGRYYDRNRHILLRLAIRASTAAPTYFKPEKFDVGGGQIGAFIDGGVSMSNNPSLQLFLLATLKGFPFRWPTGADRLLLVSIGTGTWSARDTVDNVIARWNTGWAEHIPGMLMEDASAQKLPQ